jgi:hypothetical protein
MLLDITPFNTDGWSTVGLSADPRERHSRERDPGVEAANAGEESRREGQKRFGERASRRGREKESSCRARVEETVAAEKRRG